MLGIMERTISWKKARSPGPDVAQAFQHVGERGAALAGVAGAMERRAQRKDHGDVGEIQDGFYDEVPEVSQRENEQAADKRADDAGAGDGQHVGRHGVAQHVAGHGAGDEGLAHGLGHGTAAAGQDDVQVGVPDLHAPGEHQQGEAQGERGHDQLQDDDQFASVEPVAEYAAPGSDDQTGQGVDAADGHHEEAGDGGALREVADEPADAQQLDPLGVVGEEVAAPQQTIVAVGEPRIQRVQSGER